MEHKPAFKKRVLDFRVQIFDILNKTMKGLKLFLVQKVVRKLKKQPTEEKSEKSIKNLEEKLAEIKSLSRFDIRQISFFIMKYKLHIQMDSIQSKYFEKLVPNAKDIKEDLENNQKYVKFIEAIRLKQKYQKSLDEIQQILLMVEKQKSKSKLIRQQKKEKIAIKKSNNEFVGKDQFKINRKMKETRVSQNNKKKQLEQKQQTKQQQQIRNQLPKPDQQPQRTQSFNRQTEQNIPSQPSKYTRPVNPKFAFENLHPSWQAKIELKQQQMNINDFQGKKIKLC